MNNRKILVGITDMYDPEVRAMLMAMYSRSYSTIENRLPSTSESIQQHKEKLGKFYIGYNHKSVGQLADTDIYIEGVSMLAAKAIENHPLYNGQESSSRYVDYSSQPMFIINDDITTWQEKFRTFYIKALPLVVEKLKSEFPFGFNSNHAIQSEASAKEFTTWENTIKARSFDICRGILPAGVVTNAAFKGTFDTINDHFGEMLFHPSKEMRDIAESVLVGMKKKYPYATIDLDKLHDRNEYVDKTFFYQSIPVPSLDPNVTIYNREGYLKLEGLDFFKERDKFSKMSRYNSNFFRVSLKGTLDFGSFRDIQRHRNGYLAMPELTTKYGFHEYYIDNLPLSIQNEFKVLLADYEDWYNEYLKSHSSINKRNDLQYCTPMGYRVPIDYDCDINQFLYIAELRSGKTVHQTLRSLVQDWVELFQDFYPELEIHADMDKDNFTLRRGEQVFNEKVI